MSHTRIGISVQEPDKTCAICDRKKRTMLTLECPHPRSDGTVTILNLCLLCMVDWMDKLRCVEDALVGGKAVPPETT